MIQGNKTRHVLVGVDAGSSSSGIVEVISKGKIKCGQAWPSGKGEIKWGGNVENHSVFHTLKSYCDDPSNNVTIIIEDMAPYSGQISPHTIATCKFLGELEWRLKMASIRFLLIPRSKIKDYIYNSFTGIVKPLVVRKMEKRAAKSEDAAMGLKTIDGELKKPSFIWVDDRIVVAAMREHWNIKAETGKRNKLGWKKDDHAWQALALVTCYQHSVSFLKK